MDSILTKYILLGVGLIIVVVIITVLIMSISGVTEIYGQVTKTDISIRNQVDNLIHKYDDNIFNGVDVVNALKIYEDEDNVEITFVGSAQEIQEAFNKPTQTHYTRLAEYVNAVMNGTYTEVTPSNKCQYHQLFICDVIQTGSKYNVRFNYYP